MNSRIHEIKETEERPELEWSFFALAAALQRSLFEYAPNSKPAQDYLTLFDAINKQQ